MAEPTANLYASIHPASLGAFDSSIKDPHPASIKVKKQELAGKELTGKIKNIAIIILTGLGLALAWGAIGALIGFGVGGVLGLAAAIGYVSTATHVSGLAFGVTILAGGIIGSGLGCLVGAGAGCFMAPQFVAQISPGASEDNLIKPKDCAEAVENAFRAGSGKNLGFGNRR